MQLKSTVTMRKYMYRNTENDNILIHTMAFRTAMNIKVMNIRHRTKTTI